MTGSINATRWWQVINALSLRIVLCEVALQSKVAHLHLSTIHEALREFSKARTPSLLRRHTGDGKLRQRTNAYHIGWRLE